MAKKNKNKFKRAFYILLIVLIILILVYIFFGGALTGDAIAKLQLRSESGIVYTKSSVSFINSDAKIVNTQETTQGTVVTIEYTPGAEPGTMSKGISQATIVCSTSDSCSGLSCLRQATCPRPTVSRDTNVGGVTISCGIATCSGGCRRDGIGNCELSIASFNKVT
jgi:hypothetical protein